MRRRKKKRRSLGQLPSIPKNKADCAAAALLGFKWNDVTNQCELMLPGEKPGIPGMPPVPGVPPVPKPGVPPVPPPGDQPGTHVLIPKTELSELEAQIEKYKTQRLIAGGVATVGGLLVGGLIGYAIAS